jgi:hypothetical protein
VTRARGDSDVRSPRRESVAHARCARKGV